MKNSYRFHLYLAPELLEQVKDAADAADLSAAGFIRQALREKLGKAIKGERLGDRREPPTEFPEVKRYPSSTHTFTDEEVPEWLRPPT